VAIFYLGGPTQPCYLGIVTKTLRGFAPVLGTVLVLGVFAAYAVAAELPATDAPTDAPATQAKQPATERERRSTPHVAPDGTWTSGRPRLAPDGTWIGDGKPRMAPDGTWVDGPPRLAPDGSWVGGRPRLGPDGRWLGTPRD
jgi:hypothetical protein